LNVRLNGAWPTVSAGKTFFNGAWRTLTNGKAYVSAEWHDIASFVQPVTLSAHGGGTRSTAQTMTTGATATPSGGLGPFAYSWSVLSSTNLTGISISGANTASPSITATVTPNTPGTSGTAVLQCVATDSLGQTASAQTGVNFLIFQPPTGTQ